MARPGDRVRGEVPRVELARPAAPGLYPVQTGQAVAGVPRGELKRVGLEARGSRERPPDSDSLVVIASHLRSSILQRCYDLDVLRSARVCGGGRDGRLHRGQPSIRSSPPPPELRETRAQMDGWPRTLREVSQPSHPPRVPSASWSRLPPPLRHHSVSRENHSAAGVVAR